MKAAPALRGLALKVNITPKRQNGQALQVIFLIIPAEVTKVTQQKLKDSTHILALQGLAAWVNLSGNA